jgi:hypothetical protein
VQHPFGEGSGNGRIVAFPTGGQVDTTTFATGFRIGQIAPRSEVTERIFDLNGHKTKVAYYRNKITLESDIGELESILSQFPEREDESLSETAKRNDAQQFKAAKDLCDLVVRWDWEGLLENKKGETIIAEGEPIPLDPQIVRLIPIRLTQGLNQAIVRRELGGNDGSRQKPSQRDGSSLNSMNSN